MDETIALSPCKCGCNKFNFIKGDLLRRTRAIYGNDKFFYDITVECSNCGAMSSGASEESEKIAIENCVKNWTERMCNEVKKDV